MAGDAHIVLAIQTRVPLTLSLCRNADLGTCVSMEPFTPGASIRVYAVPPGRYCLMEIYLRMFRGGTVAPGRAECFDVAADTVSYPGDLEELERGGRWVAHADIVQRVDANYPSLADRPITPVQLFENGSVP